MLAESYFNQSPTLFNLWVCVIISHLLWKMARFSSSYISGEVYHDPGKARTGLTFSHFSTGFSIGFLVALKPPSPAKVLNIEDTMISES